MNRMAKMRAKNFRRYDWVNLINIDFLPAVNNIICPPDNKEKNDQAEKNIEAKLLATMADLKL